MNDQTKVQRAFLRSLSISISIASLILAAAEDSFLPAGLTPFIALAAHLLIDRHQVVHVSIAFANVLGSLAFIATAYEFVDSSVLGKLMAGSHLLIYISWVVLLLPKGIRQYWWILALSVLQVAVASVLTDDSSFGLSVFGLMFVLIWTLSLFTLFRTQLRFLKNSDSSDALATVQDSLNVSADPLAGQESELVKVENGMQIDADEQWVGWRFRTVVAIAYFASVLVAVITFLVFPRVWVPESPLAGLTNSVQAALSRTGFTENVSLGDIGEIMQSDARVLQFRIKSTANRRDVSPERFCLEMGMDELLFRGNVMGLYELGAWDSGRPGGRVMADVEGNASLLKDVATADYRLEVSQDPPEIGFAFVPAPLRNIIAKGSGVNVNKLRYSQSTRVKTTAAAGVKPLSFEGWYSKRPKEQKIHSPDLTVGGNDNSRVLSYFSDPQLTAKNRDYFANRWCVTPDLREALPDLTKLTEDLCSDDGELVSERECTNRIFRHLNTSGEYSYSLSPRVDDYSIDPVEDFLINRKTGHCEYFASACALMLQSVGVPARLVNGYKGYEENSVNGEFEVKQKHAHSWVEVWLDGHWETLDPTPAAARNAEVNEPGSFAWWADLKMVMNDGWLSMVQKMNPEQQKQMIQPLLDSVKKQWQAMKSQGLWATVKSFFVDFLFQPSKWFSFSTLLVTFVVLLIPALIFRRNPFRWIKAKLAWLTRWARGKDGSSVSVVRFYEMFQQVCRKHGLELSDQRTAVENAEEATQFFSSALGEEQDRGLPLRIAAAFNAVRFGDAKLPAGQLQELRNDVNRLNVVLKESAGKSLQSGASESTTASVVS
ncbi:MAG: DUF3488 and transglutaminase-like domain-containing protein [Fuerstiella sp.]